MTSIISEPLVQSFLGFQLGSNLSANQAFTSSIRGMISTNYLAEILKLTVEDMIPIPSHSTAVIGVHNWRGEVLWLVDLGCLLNMQPIVHRHHPFAQYNVIIVKHKAGILGLVVEQVEQMLKLNPSEIQKSTSVQYTQAPFETINLLNIACINGYWQSPQQDKFFEINLDAVIQQLRA